MAEPLVMVIDDDYGIIEMLEAVLRRAGFDTLAAADGDRAFMTLSRGRLPHLILLDLMLPKKDGFMVLEALKADEATKNIPVYVISALDSTRDIDRAIHLGAEGVFGKPLEHSVLLKKIRTHLPSTARA